MTARDLAAEFGVRIVERRGGLGASRCVISEYHTRTKTIVLYRDTLELLAEIVQDRSLCFDPAMLAEIAIAHECAHVRFPKAREADAHAFAQELLGLADSPVLLEESLTSYLQERPA